MSSPRSSAGDGDTGASLRRTRLDALRHSDFANDADFQRLLTMVTRSLAAPVGAVALLDTEDIWFCARRGELVERSPAALSPWNHLIVTPDMPSLVVADALLDDRFARDPLVTAGTGLRFFAGAPIDIRGERIGAVGVMSAIPVDVPSQIQLAGLVDVAELAGTLFELKEESQMRARMASELIREEWRHALTLEAGKVGSWVWDLASGEITCNDIFRTMFGLDPIRRLNVADLGSMVDPRDMPALNEALEATFEKGVDYAAEFRVGPTGRWLIGRGRVYQRDAAGRPLVMMGVNIDVTDAKESAEQTRALLRELNHRVKNTLAMIQSLARQTLRQKPEPQQFIDAFSGRLRTLSDAHLLLSDRDWSGVGLIELLRSQVEPYVLAASDQLVMEGEDVRLPPDHALGLGLILHELASNAVKYGALSRPEGKVTIRWTITPAPDRRLELDWVERGGPRVAKPSEVGFGSRLIERSLDKVLNSSVQLRFPPEGAEARIFLPLE